MQNWDLLTEREIKIAVMVGDNFSNEEIAAKLKVVTQAIKNHLRNVYLKLGITETPKRLKLALMVLEEGQRLGIAPTPNSGKALGEILTSLELHLAFLLATGVSREEILSELNISHDVFKYRLKTIFDKVGLDNRIGLALRVRREFPSYK